MNRTPKNISILIGVVYIIACLLTIQDYNIMWDARNHFFKGQAFANYFLRGWKNYDSLPVTHEYARYYRDYISKNYEQPDIEKRISKDPDYRRSIYQDDVHTFEWLMKQPATEHPVLSDILSSFSNILFYEKLGWMRDDHSYHLLSIVLAGVLVGIVYYWMATSYGNFAALVATIALAAEPLFWAESHYNIKDIPLLVFFSCAIWYWHQGITCRSTNKLLISAVLAGCALATKFNAAFLPFILGPWTLIHVFYAVPGHRSWYLRHWWIVPLYPAIMLSVLYVSWPQLWYDPITNFLSVVSYYNEVGVHIDYTPNFRTVFGLNTYPVIWLIYRTYPMIIICAVAGVAGAFLVIKRHTDTLPLLFIAWLIVPFLRASLPGLSVFGGLRHIIEYIPAFSLLAGWGAFQLVRVIPATYQGIAKIALVLGFIPMVVTLYHLHPAENVYVNSFAGGLSGAREKQLTGWGNTDGGIYRIALEWINEHAGQNAHVAVGFSELADFYLPEFREDIRADNYFSGYLQEGEYIIALTHNSELEHVYRMQYAQRYLKPVFVYEIEGVPLIKIWKNDKEHALPGMSDFEQVSLRLLPSQKNNRITWDAGSLRSGVYLDISYDQNEQCKELEFLTIEVSEDGSVWLLLPEAYPAEVITSLGMQPSNGHLIAPFAIGQYRYVSIAATPETACILNADDAVLSVVQETP